MARICVITSAQPSTNPRLVKEADALSDAGHDVHVIATHHVTWADAGDDDLMRSRSWSCSYIGGKIDSVEHTWTRCRGRVARQIAQYGRCAWLDSRVVSRATPELARAARGYRADLYVAHNPGALPAAVSAAQAWNAAVGYDLEDFLAGGAALADPRLVQDEITERVERRYLPRCDYLTASSQGIRDAYQHTCDIQAPGVVLNVFPLATRSGLEPPPDTGEHLTLYWFSQTIGPDRGIQDVVRAMGLVGDPRLRLHLRGRWQAGFDRRLYTLAQEVSVAPEQICAHETGPPDEMVRLAAPYDVGLALEQPLSRNRDLCLTNKIFTYLLAGNAVLGTQTSGQLPVLQHIGNAAKSCRPGDIQTLAAHLRYWLDNRDALLDAKRSSWDWGTRRYNWDIERESYLEIVLPILEERSVRDRSTAHAGAHAP